MVPVSLCIAAPINFNAGKDVNYVENRSINIVCKIIKRQDYEEAKRNSAFIKFVRARYGKEVEELRRFSMETFWGDLEKYIEEVKVAEENYKQIKQNTVNDELKSLFPNIDEARTRFDYQEVNRLLAGFEEKHHDLLKDLAKVYYLRAQNYRLAINYQEAERYYAKAASLEDQDPFYLNAYAIILQTRGMYEEAEPLFRRALAIYEKQLGPDHLCVAMSLNNLATLLQHRCRCAESEPLYRRALVIYEKQLSPDNPDVVTSLNNLAGLLQVRGKYAEAETLYRRTLAIREKQFSLDHPDVATSLNSLAELLRFQCKYGESEMLHRRALEIREKQLSPDHSDVSESLNNLALLRYIQGDCGEAEPLYKRVLAINEKYYGPDHLHVATSLNNLAGLLAAQGKYAEAELLYGRALGIYEKQLGPNHLNTKTCAENLNKLLSKMKKREGRLTVH